MTTKSGITLITLVVTVIVMAMLATIVVITGGSSYDRTIKTGLASEINQIELLINNYVIRNDEVEFEECKLSIIDMSADERIQFEGEVLTDNNITLYIVDLQEIDAHEVNYGTGKNGTRDRYLYSKDTKKVYYDLGIEIDGVIYHRIDVLGVE